MYNDYFNDTYWIIMNLSYNIRHNKANMSGDTLDEMISLTIDLLGLLEQYKDDQYEIY